MKKVFFVITFIIGCASLHGYAFQWTVCSNADGSIKRTQDENLAKWWFRGSLIENAKVEFNQKSQLCVDKSVYVIKVVLSKKDETPLYYIEEANDALTGVYSVSDYLLCESHKVP